jgi:excisionase family DNA binding protein
VTSRTGTAHRGYRPPLDLAEAAEYLGTSERHVRRLVAEHGLPFVKLGRKVRFQVTDLDAFIEANTVRPA